MRRTLLCALLFLGSLAPAQRVPRPPPEPDEEELHREPEYTFNPLQAEKEMKVGDFYFRKKSYKAAAGRYEEAIKWVLGLSEGSTDSHPKPAK